MIDMPAMLDRLTEWIEFVRQYWSLGYAPEPGMTAMILLGVGFVLALWGARLLRAGYVIGFMVIGAAIGIRIARQHEYEILVGLVLGAGIAGLVGHVLYRWWIGLSAGLVAAAIVVSVTAPWTFRQAESFADALLQQATGKGVFSAAVAFPDALPDARAASPEPAGDGGPTIDWATVATALRPVEGQPRPGPLTLIVAWAKATWAAVPAESRGTLFMVVVAGLAGLALGGILPRFTTIAGTSVTGVAAMSISAAYLISGKAPEAWNSFQAKPAWVYGVVGLLLVVSLAFQARRGKLRQIAPVAKATPPATN